MIRNLEGPGQLVVSQFERPIVSTAAVDGLAAPHHGLPNALLGPRRRRRIEQIREVRDLVGDLDAFGPRRQVPFIGVPRF